MNYISKVIGIFLAVFSLSATMVYAEEALQPMPVIGSLETGSTVTESDFSKDGKYIATGDTAGMITIWDASTLSQVTSWHGGISFNGIEKLRYSPDGQKIVVTGMYEVTISNVATGQVEHSYETDFSDINDVAFNREGSMIYIASNDGLVTFLDVKTGQIQKQLNVTDTPKTLAYNEQTDELAVGIWHGGIKLYEGETGAYKKSIFLDPNIPSYHVSYSNDYSELLIGTGGPQPLIFDVNHQYQPIRLSANEYTGDGSSWNQMGFSSTNEYVATVGGNRVMVYDRSTKKVVSSEYRVSNTTPVFSPDMQRLLVGKHVFDTSVLPSTKLEKLTIVKETTDMSVGDLQTIQLSGLYSDGSQKVIPFTDVKWTIANLAVAKFSYGKLEALSPGVTEVKGEYKGMSASFVLTVQNFKELDPKKDIVNDKIWTVKFSAPVDIMTIKENNIYVTDATGEIVPMLYYVEKGKESTVQMIPVKAYQSKQTYTLWVKDVNSSTGTPIKQYTKMDFTIR